MNEKENKRPFKGKSLLSFPDDYTVVDIETTGLSGNFCEIIEISAIRFRDNARVSDFSTLIRPRARIPLFITRLTGITNEAVKDAPDVARAMRAFFDYLGDDLIMGYNVNFDIGFLYDNMMRVYGVPIRNDYVDVLRFARRALKHLDSRAQTTVAAHYGIETQGAHRALRDCEICQKIYMKLKEEPALAALKNGTGTF